MDTDRGCSASSGATSRAGASVRRDRASVASFAGLRDDLHPGSVEASDILLPTMGPTQDSGDKALVTGTSTDVTAGSQGSAEDIRLPQALNRRPGSVRSALAISGKASMGRSGIVDRELTALIEEVIAADLLAPSSPAMEVARFVADHGQAGLDPRARDIFEQQLLPILSKPIHEQVAIASIVRRGGYVPRKIRI